MARRFGDRMHRFEWPIRFPRRFGTWAIAIPVAAIVAAVIIIVRTTAVADRLIIAISGA